MRHVDTSNPNVTVVWEADEEEWTPGERRELLRLLFGPRLTDEHEPQATAVESVVSSDQPTTENNASPAALGATEPAS